MDKECDRVQLKLIKFSLKEGKRKLNIDQLKTEKGERHRAIKNWKMNMKEIN